MQHYVRACINGVFPRYKKSGPFACVSVCLPAVCLPAGLHLSLSLSLSFSLSFAAALSLSPSLYLSVSLLLLSLYPLLSSL